MRFTGHMGRRPRIIDFLSEAIFEKFYATSVVIDGKVFTSDRLGSIPNAEREILSIVFEDACWIIVTAPCIEEEFRF